MVSICNSDECTGCIACVNVCSKNAIHMICNEMAVPIACVDEQLCVNCGTCLKTCPVMTHKTLHQPLKCYAAWSTKKEHIEECSSGGIGAALSELMLDSGGMVCGALFDLKVGVRHILTDSYEVCKAFRSSKYVQSEIGSVYKEIKDQLNTEKQILFIGTPCQVAGLRGFLKSDYEKLFCVDLICHGVPPKKYLQEWVDSVAKGKSVDDVRFRGKDDFKLKIYNGSKLIYECKRDYDSYFYSFLKGLIFRENCYKCRFAQIKRSGDLTIGDFWGLQRQTMRHKYTGKISVVLVNTKKGMTMFEKLLSDTCIIAEERMIEEAVAGNLQLRQPSVKHKKREIFKREYTKSGFVMALKKAGIEKEISILRVKQSKIYQTVRIFVKRIKNG